MTAEGPFGFPRVTGIGPFSEHKAEQTFTREVDEDSLLTGLFLDRELSSIHGTDINSVTMVNAKLVVREKIPESNSIMGDITNEVSAITREENVGRIGYWFDSETQVGRVISVNVKEDFRRMGIATQLKNQELEYMKDQDIEVVYTDVISDGGYRLAKSTGFKPIHEADHLVGTEATLTFQNNRGIMFKYL